MNSSRHLSKKRGSQSHPGDLHRRAITLAAAFAAITFAGPGQVWTTAAASASSDAVAATADLDRQMAFRNRWVSARTPHLC